MDRRHHLLISTGLLLLRIGFGGYLLAHGWGKLQMLFGGQAGSFADPIGLGPTLTLLLTVFAEVLCSILVILGLFTRLAAIPVVVQMALAAAVVHGADPWLVSNAQNGSKEPALLYGLAFLALVFTGGGAYALDAPLWRRWRERRAGGERSTTAALDQSS